MISRASKVREIMAAAYAGADTVVDETTTADEVFLAYINMCRDNIAVARKGGADPTVLQHLVELILLECHAEGPPH